MKEKAARYSTTIYSMTALKGLGELGAKGQSRGIVFILLERESVRRHLVSGLQKVVRMLLCFLWADQLLPMHWSQCCHWGYSNSFLNAVELHRITNRSPWEEQTQAMWLCHDLMWVCLLYASILPASSASERALIWKSLHQSKSSEEAKWPPNTTNIQITWPIFLPPPLTSPTIQCTTQNVSQLLDFFMLFTFLDVQIGISVNNLHI